ncbi:MAG: DUF3604 domain-containing protein [Novosphingobium sp.]|uniref:DUF3604 domain-containing protein n=1 Tax=Novosphingobium sp. TaxID=1874826 RepID=UPI0032BBBD43
MKIVTATALGALVLALGLWQGSGGEAPAGAKTVKPAAVVQAAYPQRPLWGDTHLHTANSFDAFTAGLRLGPEEALRFARGEGVKTASGEIAKLHRPLDFLAVTDHSDAIGVTADLYNTPEDQITDPTLKRWRTMMHVGGNEAYKAFREMVTAAASGTLPPDFANPERQKIIARRIWDSQLEAVERYNQPGKFTALVAFEFSLQPKGNTLHRNVIYRDGADRARGMLPFPSDGTKSPEALWNYMDAYAKATGGQMLAIPHNSNLSNGMAFMTTNWDGGPLTAEMARRRAGHEPLVEMTQYKGDSESHPFLSRNDEFADFGDAGWENGNAPLRELKKPEMLGGEYVREVLKRGLQIESKTGINPYMLGMIGSTDSHTALASADEDNFHGKFSTEGPGPERVGTVVNPGIKESRIGWQYQAGGLAAVWANSNTREGIFDAMQRREVYATTGPRMTVRVFAGWNFTKANLGGDWVKTGYARGVPMGGVMKPGPRQQAKAAPSLMISAMKDPEGANLDRVQVIKGWIDAQGQAHEKIYDVAWSSPAKRRIVGGKLAPVGDTIDMKTATYRNSIGAPLLMTVWRDPEFRADQRAFYYIRVLEIPTPRWVLYDMVRFGAKPPADARLKDQERAYTSPIWYRPES